MSEAEIRAARSRRGMVRSRLTRVDKDIEKLQEKVQAADLESSDQRKIKRLIEQVNEYDKEFEQRHLEVMDLLDGTDQETMEAEDKIFEQHCNRIMDLLEKLEEWQAAEDTVTPASPASSASASDPSENMMKRLRFLEEKKDKIIKLRTTIPVEPVAQTQLRLRKFQQDVAALEARIAGLEDEILS